VGVGRYQLDRTREPAYRPTWKPTTAGIISIICGVVAFPPALIVPFLVGMMFISHYYFPQAVGGGVITILSGVAAIIGGINAIRRKRFHLALTGAVASCVALTLAVFFFRYEGTPYETFIALPIMGIAIIAAVALARNRKLAIFALIALVIVETFVGYYYFIHMWKGYAHRTPFLIYPHIAFSIIGVVPIVLILLSRKEFK